MRSSGLFMRPAEWSQHQPKLFPLKLEGHCHIYLVCSRLPPFRALHGRPALCSGRLLPEPWPPRALHGVVFYGVLLFVIQQLGQMAIRSNERSGQTRYR
jgi:hypothetical protein